MLTGSTNGLPAFLTIHYSILKNQGSRIAEDIRCRLEADAVFSAIRPIIGIVPFRRSTCVLLPNCYYRFVITDTTGYVANQSGNSPADDRRLGLPGGPGAVRA